MSATNSIIFYPSDWLGEPTLRLCSLAAHGLWMQMLCLAWDAEERGFVMIGPSAATAADLAKITGAPLEEISGLLLELKSKGVFSTDRRGWMYCRRMVRDERDAQLRIQRASSGGKAAASANPRDEKGKFRQAGVSSSPSSSSSSSTTPKIGGESGDSPPPEVGQKAPGGGGEAPQLELLAQDVQLSPSELKKRAVECFNAVAPLGGWVPIRALTKTRERGLEAALKRLGGLDGWAAMLETAAKLKFFDCTRPREGKHANWRPSLEFFLSETKQIRIAEGAYDKYGSNPQPLHGLTGGARLAALALAGSLDREGLH